MKLFYLILFLSASSFAQMSDLKIQSEKMNKELPEIIDHITKLRATTVQNNDLYYHYLVNATQQEFNLAFPKVKAQILKTICTQKREKIILKSLKANIVYQYENLKGQSLGEFLIRPTHCP